MKRTIAARSALSVLYFAFSFVLIYYISARDNYFCLEPTGTSPPLAAARLALACTFWDQVASVCAFFVAPAFRSNHRLRVIGVPFVSGMVAAIGLGSVPFWIYRGFDRGFLFEHTAADVSCLFTEGYGLAFLFLLAPLLVIGHLAREILEEKILRTSGSQPSTSPSP